MNLIIIYGVGERGKRLFLQLRDVVEELFLAVTNSAKEEYSDFLGTPIYSLAELGELKAEAVVIVASVGKNQKDMIEYAKRVGFKNVLHPNIHGEYERLTKMPYLDLKKEITEWYAIRRNKWIDIDHPQNFDEKIQWLKLYDSTSTKTNLADKYRVREYVKDIIGEEYLIPLIGVWNGYDEIEFDRLPERFVLKCNHGSSMNEIIKSKQAMDHELLKNRFNEWLNIDYSLASGFEMHYRDIKRKIIAEEYIVSDDGEDLKDYKVHVFGGKAKLIQVDIGRYSNHRRNLYTTKWEYLPYSICYPTAPDIVIEKPSHLDEMIMLAEKLAEGFMYVRVDFYISNNRIFFGEMTFTHGSGDEIIIPYEFGIEMGNWIQLAKNNHKVYKEQSDNCENA